MSKNAKYESVWGQAVRQFFSSTTLHGFKYLISQFRLDRLGWLICCCTSMCCAGLLCTVLWTRFLEVPAILELWDLRSEENAYQHMPLVAICSPVHASADLLAQKLTQKPRTNTSEPEDAKITLAQVLATRQTSVDELMDLEMLISTNNITLGDLVSKHLPTCEELMLKCRWQNMMVPCNALFKKELTPWGLCCVMRPIEVLNAFPQPKKTRLSTTKGLDLALRCSEDPIQGCRFISTFEVEETVEPMVVRPGFNYFAQLRFFSVPQNAIKDLDGVSCNPNADYSRTNCLAKCAERLCGCTNPLRPKNNDFKNGQPDCTVVQLECLRVHQKNAHCHCLPCCNKVTTYVTLESGRMDVLESTLDPMYSDLNSTSSVLHLKVYINLSRIFTMNPTETWLSLLSSLGGVFNMFLGVGLFSALEILFLLFVKLPIAFNNSADLSNPQPSRF